MGKPFVLFDGPLELTCRICFRSGEDDHRVVIRSASPIGKRDTLHSLDGLNRLAQHNQRRHDESAQRIAFAGKQHYDKRRVVLSDTGNTYSKAPDLLEFSHHARIQKTGHDIPWGHAPLRGAPVAPDGGQRILKGRALEHLENSLDLPAGAAKLHVNQSVRRHQSSGVRVAQLLQKRLNLANDVGLVAVVGDQLGENDLGLLLLLLLEITHPLPVHRLGDVRAAGGTVVDDPPVDLDGRIEISVHLLGVQPFLKQPACLPGRRGHDKQRRRQNKDDCDAFEPCHNRIPFKLR